MRSADENLAGVAGVRVWRPVRAENVKEPPCFDRDPFLTLRRDLFADNGDTFIVPRVVSTRGFRRVRIPSLCGVSGTLPTRFTKKPPTDGSDEYPDDNFSRDQKRRYAQRKRDKRPFHSSAARSLARSRAWPRLSSPVGVSRNIGVSVN